jgi:hypothetical protein
MLSHFRVRPEDARRPGEERNAGRGRYSLADKGKGGIMRGALLWFLGIPIPVIILLYVFHVI